MRCPVILPEFRAMRILLCAATETEISSTVNAIEANGWPVDVLITGVGLTAATHSLTKAVLQNRPVEIVQAGIAGSLNPSIPLGEVLVVESDTVGDLGVTEAGAFKSVFDMGFADADVHPWWRRRLWSNSKDYKQWGLLITDGVTVNEVSTDPERIRYYNETLHAGVESMEGAALHYVGLMEDVLFTQLRAVSNYAGERDKSKWMVQEAVDNLNRHLQRLFKIEFER